jgi:hypothetical protein
MVFLLQCGWMVPLPPLSAETVTFCMVSEHIYMFPPLTLPTPYSPTPSFQGRKGSQTNKNNVNWKSFVGFPAERVRAVCCGWRSLRPVWRPTATAGGRAPDIGRYESKKKYRYFILFSSHTGKEGILFCRKKSQGFLL